MLNNFSHYQSAEVKMFNNQLIYNIFAFFDYDDEIKSNHLYSLAQVLAHTLVLKKIDFFPPLSLSAMRSRAKKTSNYFY
jgi:hypothetical protein